MGSAGRQEIYPGEQIVNKVHREWTLFCKRQRASKVTIINRIPWKGFMIYANLRNRNFLRGEHSFHHIPPKVHDSKIDYKPP